MKQIITCLLLVSSTVLLAQKTIINDPNAQPRKVSAFNSISISNGIDLYLSQGDEVGVAVSAGDPRITEQIRATVENNELKIYLDKKNRKYQRNSKKMIAYVSFTSLKRLSAHGASDVYVNGLISGETLDIKLSGASDFKGKVDVGQLNINQSGASDVSISGKASTFSVDASGASDLVGFDLETDKCSAEASGASDIKVTVKSELNARASGASSINYRGGGQVKQSHTSGASQINKKG